MSPEAEDGAAHLTEPELIVSCLSKQHAADQL